MNINEPCWMRHIVQQNMPSIEHLALAFLTARVQRHLVHHTIPAQCPTFMILHSSSWWCMLSFASQGMAWELPVLCFRLFLHASPQHTCRHLRAAKCPQSKPPPGNLPEVQRQLFSMRSIFCPLQCKTRRR